MGYLNSYKKVECFGCEACSQICSKGAIQMVEDSEGFYYPEINQSLCIECGLCRKVCPNEHSPKSYTEKKYTFGGYHKDKKIKYNSTSGGAFSAILESFCDKNYVIFGAEAKGLFVFHNCTDSKKEAEKFRKSKYRQSTMGNCFELTKKYLLEGKKVLFSGTPCQIAGLRAFLQNINCDLLLTVEVICEGVPSPLYIKKYERFIKKKYGSEIQKLDYRYKGKSILGNSKWDFQIMKTITEHKNLEKDRWFNPFWSIWLNHLMSRPSCYSCPFTKTERMADITLGDLWGVHKYCPELYGKNGGASLVVCNTKKGMVVFKEAKKYMYGHALKFDEALKFQSPMRKTIDMNPKRKEFMHDLIGSMDYLSLNRKWAKKITLKLFFEKYIWGNRQKVFLWNIKRKITSRLSL